jgi:hypothetical protein
MTNLGVMRDAAGNALAVGDVVASTDGGHAGVVLFEVTDLTAKKVRLLRLDGAAMRGKSTTGNRAAGVTKTMFPEQVVKTLVQPTHQEALATEAEATFDASVRELLNTWKRDADEYLNTWGQHMPCSLESCIEHLEAAINAPNGAA